MHAALKDSPRAIHNVEPQELHPGDHGVHSSADKNMTTFQTETSMLHQMAIDPPCDQRTECFTL